MIDIEGCNGVEVHTVTSYSTDDDVTVIVELNSQTRDLLDFVRSAKTSSGVVDGYQFGETIFNLVQDVASLQTQINQDQWYRDNNPAVGEAWKQYQLMLGLARENDRKD